MGTPRSAQRRRCSALLRRSGPRPDPGRAGRAGGPSRRSGPPRTRRPRATRPAVAGVDFLHRRQERSQLVGRAGHELVDAAAQYLGAAWRLVVAVQPAVEEGDVQPSFRAARNASNPDPDRFDSTNPIRLMCTPRSVIRSSGHRNERASLEEVRVAGQHQGAVEMQLRLVTARDRSQHWAEEPDPSMWMAGVPRSAPTGPAPRRGSCAGPRRSRSRSPPPRGRPADPPRPGPARSPPGSSCCAPCGFGCRARCRGRQHVLSVVLGGGDADPAGPHARSQKSRYHSEISRPRSARTRSSRGTAGRCSAVFHLEDPPGGDPGEGAGRVEVEIDPGIVDMDHSSAESAMESSELSRGVAEPWGFGGQLPCVQQPPASCRGWCRPPGTGRSDADPPHPGRPQLRDGGRPGPVDALIGRGDQPTSDSSTARSANAGTNRQSPPASA